MGNVVDFNSKETISDSNLPKSKPSDDFNPMEAAKFESEFSIKFADYFSEEMEQLKELENDGLLNVSDNSIKIIDCDLKARCACSL